MPANSLLEPVFQRLDQIAIAQRQQRRRQFHHAHRGSQFGVDRAHFEPDVSAADHQQALGHVGQFERAGRAHHAIGADLKCLGHGRNRTGGEDAVFERESRLAVRRRVAAFESQRGGVLECRPGVDECDLAFLGQLLQAAGKTVYYLVLARSDAVDVDGRRFEFDAPLAHLATFADNASHVQKRLGRNASLQQARAA